MTSIRVSVQEDDIIVSAGDLRVIHITRANGSDEWHIAELSYMPMELAKAELVAECYLVAFDELKKVHVKHEEVREGDEIYCKKCGRRWDVAEQPPARCVNEREEIYHNEKRQESNNYRAASRGH